MFTQEQMQQLQQLLEENNKKIRIDTRESIIASENRLRQEFRDELDKQGKTLMQEISLQGKTFSNKLDQHGKTLRQEINQQAKTLIQKMEEMRDDIINVVSDLLNICYNLHDARIKRIENHLNLPPLKQ